MIQTRILRVMDSQRRDHIRDQSRGETCILRGVLSTYNGRIHAETVAVDGSGVERQAEFGGAPSYGAWGDCTTSNSLSIITRAWEAPIPRSDLYLQVSRSYGIGCCPSRQMTKMKCVEEGKLQRVTGESIAAGR